MTNKDKPGDTTLISNTPGSPETEFNRLGSEQVGQTLRWLAEDIIQKKAGLSQEGLKARSPEEMQHILHELRVHQIALEIQNKELGRIQEELEASQARFVDLYDSAPVGYLTVDKSGLILEANLTAATQLGVQRSSLLKKSTPLWALLQANESKDGGKGKGDLSTLEDFK